MADVFLAYDGTYWLCKFIRGSKEHVSTGNKWTTDISKAYRDVGGTAVIMGSATVLKVKWALGLARVRRPQFL